MKNIQIFFAGLWPTVFGSVVTILLILLFGLINVYVTISFFSTMIIVGVGIFCSAFAKAEEPGSDFSYLNEAAISGLCWIVINALVLFDMVLKAKGIR